MPSPNAISACDFEIDCDAGRANLAASLMHWIAPSEKDAATATLEKRFWDTADQLRANSGLKAQEYSGPILGIIFLRFAEVRFAQQRAKLEKASANDGKGNLPRCGSRVDEPAAHEH